MIQLCGIVITYNEEAHITDCLESLSFCDDRLVYDAFSTDATVNLVQQAGVRMVQREWDHFAGQRNAALDSVKGHAEWVLFLDADERITPALADEIRATIATGDCVGYQIPRHNYLFGKLTRGAGWLPDYQTRLLKVGSAQYDPQRKVHELVILDGELGTMSRPLVHYNYRDTAQFHTKQRKYSQYDAQILFESGVRPRPHNYLLQPWRQFWWRLVTLKGYTDGLHGLHLSLLMAFYEWRKYWLLGRLWKQPGTPERPQSN